MPRIRSLDLARGFTVLFMPAIHTAMLCSDPSIAQTLPGRLLTCIAEGPGAQLFMLLMGVSFTFSGHSKAKPVFQRALYLLLAAYGLNVLKFIVPLWLGWLPEAFLQELGVTGKQTATVFFFWLGDILHFAAIAYALLFLVSRLKGFGYWSLLAAITIIFISPLIWDMHSRYPPLNYLLQLAGGHPPAVFFPLFPWLTYPLCGLSIGRLLHRYDRDQVFALCGWTGLILCVITIMIAQTAEHTTPQTAWSPFYRTAPLQTFFHLGIVLGWIGIVHRLTVKMPGNPFFGLLVFCSRNITAIYIMQWVLVFGCIGFTGYRTLGFSESVIWVLLLTGASLFFTWLLNRCYGRNHL